MSKNVEQLERVVIRIAGDSGDGMQLTGDRFTQETASFGNDLSTLPNFPAEIRAPAGTLPGVSSFQLHFADHDILTPGDRPDVLVAMNPAALKANLVDLPKGGTIIVDTHDFTDRALARIGWTSNPLEDGTLDSFTVHAVDLTQFTLDALAGTSLSRKDAGRSKNMFALGLLSWMYSRPVEGTLQFLRQKFASRPDIADANITAFKAGWNFGETTESFAVAYEVKPAPLPAGVYRNITGNMALSYGLIAAAQRAGLPLFLGAYPITPASDILHELSKHKRFGVRTFQAEDEIAGIGAAIGAAFGGSLAITSSSGPGIALKGESIGLAVSLEIPLVVCDIQRGGPSTGLPTKTEQADLLQALFGRNSEAPIPVIAPATPSDCFWAAVEASRIAVKYMVPVIILSDGYLANGAEPWKIPDLDAIPDFKVKFATDPVDFKPYRRNPDTLARPWAVPGTPGLEHRIGGLEKQDVTGNINYEPLNHENMVRIRAAKVEAIAQDIPDAVPAGDPDGDLLIVAWGSTHGAITAAVKSQRELGHRIGHVHLRHLNPLPSNLGDVLKRYKQVLVPELNMGQLLWLLRAKFLVNAIGLNKIQGRPFKQSELEQKISELVS